MANQFINIYYVVSDSNMTSYTRNLKAPSQLSLRVNELLDRSGLSEEMRKLLREFAYTMEIANSIGSPRVFVFGSTIESTQIPGMNSDVDLTLITPLEVFTECSNSCGKFGFIFVQDENTPPGHVKLQAIDNNVHWQETPENYELFSDINNRILSGCKYHFLPDDKGRIVLTNQPGYRTSLPNVTKHGVALKRAKGFGRPDLDIVHALQSKLLPDYVTDYLKRKRNTDFLTPSVVEACKSYGCLFVRKGHRQSKDSHLLWRISPSHQERFLMFNFNSVQYKCYVLLKLIKKDIINPALGSEVLTSYHCKTAMLHLIDMAPSQFWRPDNLLFCLITALHCLLLWSKDSNCPNFFIPDENMFRWRISRHLLKRLSDELFRLVSLDFGSLLISIKTDNFQYSTLAYDGPCLQMGVINSQLLRMIMCRKHVIVLKCYSNCINDLVDNLSNQLSILKHTDRLDIHSPINLTRRTIALLAPYIEIYLMSNNVALSVKRGDTRETTWGYLTSVRWHEFSHSSDPFTSILKQASLMSALGYHCASLDVLSTIENKKERFNGCGCIYKNDSNPPLTLEQQKRLATAATVHKLLHQIWMPCVLFLPTEKEVVPSALCYEMSILEAPKNADYFYDHWAFVDGTFLLHFLLYLNRKNLGLSFEADIQEMEEFLKNERPLVHRDTDLNLLGWAYKEEGKLDRAYECFKKSLHIRPQQKAAIWHILCLISILRV